MADLPLEEPSFRYINDYGVVYDRGSSTADLMPYASAPSYEESIYESQQPTRETLPDDFPVYIESRGKYTNYKRSHPIGWIQLVTFILHFGYVIWTLIISNFVIMDFWIPTGVIMSTTGLLLCIHFVTLLVFYSANVRNGIECMSHSFTIEIALGFFGALGGFVGFFWFSFAWIFTFKGGLLHAFPDPTNIQEWQGYQAMLTRIIFIYIITLYPILRGVIAHFNPSKNLSRAIGKAAMNIKTNKLMVESPTSERIQQITKQMTQTSGTHMPMLVGNYYL